MEKQSNKEKKIIQFESTDLFKELVDGKQLKNLRSVKSNPYPNYCFIATDKVIDIVSAFIVNHDMKSDRMIDKSWEYFDTTVVNAENKPETIVTRNPRVVRRIVAEGYGCMLKRTGVDQYKKKFFVFYANDRIAEIKAEEDTQGKERFEKKIVVKASPLNMNDTKNKINMEMSKLLKKAMEAQK